jgi:hypothetical protein
MALAVLFMKLIALVLPSANAFLGDCCSRPRRLAKCGKASEPDHVFHRSHRHKEDAAQGSFDFLEGHGVRLDPSIHTAGEVAFENAQHAVEYPDLASVPDAPNSRPASIEHSGGETVRTEIAS